MIWDFESPVGRSVELSSVKLGSVKHSPAMLQMNIIQQLCHWAANRLSSRMRTSRQLLHFITFSSPGTFLFSLQGKLKNKHFYYFG